MGLEYYTSRFLLQARAAGLNFGRVLTIGRQSFIVTLPQLQKLAAEFAFDLDTFTTAETPAALAYVEPFLQRLAGATAVESIDISSYEGATHVQDMNAPLLDDLKAQYDTVLECGSLEHIFNFPTAIKNLMEAVKPGGTIFLQTPANNYFGHGFYQFSPELFYRIFSAENGFEIRRMELLEHFYPCHFFNTKTYAVTDPAAVQRRVQLVNNRPALLLIEARRTAVKPIFAAPPQQSDYVPLWNKDNATTSTTAICLDRAAKFKVYGLPLAWVGRLWLQYFGRKHDRPSLGNPDFFKRNP